MKDRTNCTESSFHSALQTHTEDDGRKNREDHVDEAAQLAPLKQNPCLTPSDRPMVAAPSAIISEARMKAGTESSRRFSS